MVKHSTILIVDDDTFNLEILDRSLRKSNYQTELARNGDLAWDLMTANPHKYSLVLLDRMMPVMDGMEVLEKMKAHPDLKYLPVIMQTSASSPGQISEGIARGAYYYLTKPFNRTVLLSLVAAAINDYNMLLNIKKNLESNTVSMRNLEQARFTFKTIEEGKNIVNLLAYAGKNPLDLAIGLIELVVNAIEHGNLGITYQEKGVLLANEALEVEICRRYQIPPYKNKYATLYLEKETGKKEGKSFLKTTISDQGNGFNWHPFMELSMERLFDSHGRGILMARNIFSRLEYLDNGSSVSVWFEAAK